MNIISIGDFQLLTPNLVNVVGEEYVIVDVKKKLIVGKIQVMEAPQSLAFTEQYTKKEKIKGVITHG